MKYLIGIDEVGRGPIAGPVAVGAFVFLTPQSKDMFKGVKESKQLSEKKREQWFEEILKAQTNGDVDFCVSFQNEKVIDEKGIVYAIKECLNQSLGKLNINPTVATVLLDGGLKAPVEYMNQETIIKGDTKEDVIALASICAKVTRDRKMKEYGKMYPEYGFEVHKGYGTRAHYEAIKKKGISLIHRQSFLQKRPI